MKTISLSEFYKTNFDGEVFSCLRQQWTDAPQFSCIGVPKADELFLFLCGYEATYYFPDGTTKTASDKSAVYSPSGSEYLVKFKKIAASDGGAYTIGIRFCLLSGGEKTRLAESVTFFENAAAAQEFFETELFVCKKGDGVQAEKKAELFRLLVHLGKSSESPLFAAESGFSIGNFETIQASFDFLNAHYESDKTIEEIAAMSYVSPVWFRKLFKQQTGVTPAEYRVKLRLKQAENYLKFGNMSVREIAEAVGYNDVSLFIRHFKRFFGVTPLAARNRAQK